MSLNQYIVLKSLLVIDNNTGIDASLICSRCNEMLIYILVLLEL